MKKILIVLMMTATASAGFLVEPYLAYRIGSYDANANSEFSYDGPLLGARLGYTMTMFMAGIDYNMGKTEMKSDTTGVADGGDYKSSTFGLFVGVELPVLLRAWATYYVAQTLEVDEGTAAGSEYKGDGIGLGVGFTGLPIVSLNLEYRKFDYDELKTSAGTAKIDTSSSEILLSVSAPFDF